MSLLCGPTRARCCLTGSLVDEVIQEASVTLWQKFDQLRDEAGFLPWAKVVVRFKCLSEIGKLRRDRQVFSEGVLEMLADEAEAFDVEERERSMRALRSCLDRFTPAASGTPARALFR